MELIIPFKSSDKTPERDRNLASCVARIEQLNYRYRIVQDEAPFNRARLLNKGISESKDELFFCLDCDMLIPDNFDFLLENVLSYYDIFFPICMKQKEQTGYDWGHGGLGLVGCKRETWNRFGLSWNEARVVWGGEDNDLYEDCKIKRMNIARFWCLGLIHMWHPVSLEYKNANAK